MNFRSHAKVARERYKARPFYPNQVHKSCLYDRAKNYEITREALQQLAKDQDYRCAICGYPKGKSLDYRIGNINQLCIDHNHATNQVRGLLCRGCNYAIGLLKEDPQRFVKAMVYLENPPYVPA